MLAHFFVLKKEKKIRAFRRSNTAAAHSCSSLPLLCLCFCFGASLRILPLSIDIFDEKMPQNERGNEIKTQIKSSNRLPQQYHIWKWRFKYNFNVIVGAHVFFLFINISIKSRVESDLRVCVCFFFSSFHHSMYAESIMRFCCTNFLGAFAYLM